MGKRALIVRLNAIGDIVEGIPAVHALYKQGFEIHWICGKSVQSLLECYPWITLLPVNEKEILVGTLFQQASNIVHLWHKLLFKSYDLCAILNYDWRYRILTLPVRTRRRVSLSHKSRETTVLAGRSRTDEYARILLDVEDGCREKGFQPIYPEKLPLSPLSASTAERRVAIVPGGASNIHHQEPLRRWPVTLYVELAGRLRERNWEVILLGGPDDLWVKPYFQHIEITDCIGKLSLPEVISTCETCDAVISHDTGPLHLAGITKTCLIGIFGPTDPSKVLPRRPNVLGIWGGQGFACRPCYDGHSYAPCRDNRCMHQVTPDLVVRELDRLLEIRSRGISEPWQLIFPVPCSI